MPQICAFLVRSQAWLEYGFNDPTLRLGMEDYESHVRMFANDVRGIALPETLFSYRKRAGSMSKAFEPHGVAALYRRIWQANPELLRRFGPELVGLYAENGHGALAPSACEASPHNIALFGRDIPALESVAEGLEARASRELLGRALRARCWDAAAEWDYTTARLLLALDMEPAFARSLLRDAARRAPRNGWFRFYAIIAELRDGRISAADALWNEDFTAFCVEEAGALGWVAALEDVRGFPHVTLALHAWLAGHAKVQIAAPCSHAAQQAHPGEGPFGALHAALHQLRSAEAEGGLGVSSRAEEAVRHAASCLSEEAVDALLKRWRLAWRDAGGLDGRSSQAAPTFWGRPSHAYIGDPATASASLTPLETQDQHLWADLTPREPGTAAAVAALGRRLLAARR